MTQPPDPQIVIDGQTLYYNPYSQAYTPSRSYGLRMQRGYARGLTQTQARRAATPRAAINRLGISESQYRRQQIRQRQEELRREQEFLAGIQFRSQYGFELSYWNYLRASYVDEINQNRVEGSNIDVIQPQSVADIIQLYNMGAVDITEYDTWQGWVEHRLEELMEDIRDYKRGQYQPGQVNFYSRPAYTPIEFWWYH